MIQEVVHSPEGPLYTSCVSWHVVWNGDLNQFGRILDENGTKFRVEKTYMLIVHLRHNVIKTGIRMTSLSRWGHSGLVMGSQQIRGKWIHLSNQDTDCPQGIRGISFSDYETSLGIFNTWKVNLATDLYEVSFNCCTTAALLPLLSLTTNSREKGSEGIKIKNASVSNSDSIVCHCFCYIGILAPQIGSCTDYQLMLV